MKKLSMILFWCLFCMITACSPIKVPISNQYKLASFSAKQRVSTHRSPSLLISEPEAMAGYQTEQMLYISKPFEISSFAHSAWVSPPARMVYPLLIQSIQESNYFYAVASGVYADTTDYRLDTQLITLQQNFLVKPSVLEWVAKVVLTHISDNRAVASRVIIEHIKCPQDTPYGGVIAANQATLAFTAKVTAFVIDKIARDYSALAEHSK